MDTEQGSHMVDTIESQGELRSATEGRRRWLWPVVALSSAVVLTIAFLHLGSEVGEGETLAFDRWFLHLAEGLRQAQPGLADVMRDLSGIGSTIALTLVTVGVSGYLALTGRFGTGVLAAGSIAAATLVVRVLKIAFARARPDAMHADYAATGFSFPSGHTSMSAVVFLTIGVLVARAHASSLVRRYITAAAILMAVLVGISRVALGVHWATDVLGGWAFGTAWATLTVLIANHLDRRTGSAK